MNDLKQILKAQGITPKDLIDDPEIGSLTKNILREAFNRDIVDAINEIELALIALTLQFERMTGK